MFTSVEELNKMVRRFWLTFQSAPSRWSRPVLGIAVKTKRDVQKEFASELTMYQTLAKADGNKEVVNKIANFAAGIIGDDSDDGSSQLAALAKDAPKEES